MSHGPEDVALALEAIAGDTASFEVRASLEHYPPTVLEAGGVEGVATLLNSISGREFGPGLPGPTPGGTSFHSPESGHPQLVIDTFLSSGLASVNVSIRREEVARLEPDPRHQPFYEVWEDFLGGPERPVASLEPWPKAVFLIGLLESEVMNGGFGQYLSNTEGVFVEETLACLERVGAKRAGDLLRAAERIGAAEVSYVAGWESDSAALEELDDRFLDSGEDLAGLTADHFLGSDATR